VLDPYKIKETSWSLNAKQVAYNFSYSTIFEC